MLHHATVLVGVPLLIATFPSVSAVAAAADELSPLMLVLDSSGSMTARDAGGSGTRLDAAKRAVSSMVDTLPATASVGLTIYGAGTGSSRAEKSAGCRDIQVVRAVSVVDKPALKNAVTTAKARGYTPIGNALRVAASQLPKEGQRSIVLVSDGEDTCAPPEPCEVAKELSKQGVDLHVHTIGFRVDPAARAQLTCIAQQTGGTYHDAADADSLIGVLGRVTERALRKYEPVGKPIIGTADPGTAPEVEPGQYRDTLNAVEERYYVADLQAGDTAYFAATAILPRGNPRGLEVLDIKVTGPGGAECRSAREIETRARDGSALTTLVTWDGLAPGGAAITGCTDPGRYAFRITRLHNPGNNGTDRVPVELLLQVEAPVTGDKGADAQTAIVDFSRPPTGPARAVRAGSSFNAATALAGPGRYTETIYNGELLFYRVKLDWGQGLAYRVTYGGTPNGLTANVRTNLYNPFRATVNSYTTAYTGTTAALPPGKAIGTPRVMYQNRTSNDQNIQRAGASGWYYIVIKLGVGVSIGVGNSGAPRGVPVTLDLAIAGSRVAGPEGTTTPSPSESPTPEPTDSPAATASESPAPAPEAGIPAASDSTSPWLWVTGGAAVLLAAAIVTGAVIVRRRPPGL
nr:VWA domain-containing protein [Kribbella shirazensis]